MDKLKRILTPIFSLMILTNPVSIHLCLATELPPGTDEVLCCQVDNHPDHDQTSHHNKSPTEAAVELPVTPQGHDQSSHHNKSPTPTNHDCCNLIAPDTMSYLSVLNSYPLSPVEIVFLPLEITQSLFRPPRTHF